ncbi:acyltransferase family protein [Leifsonia poae]|uniref:Acyltransferase n=1 Tax=Leifsonia poae TaxID=110933 RepID=A0A9W6H6U3_9MICO|nr:acyltransferase family protein [Leifsonia poae]GLJ75020.1 acyltransferase [Leifsonia poae]
MTSPTTPVLTITTSPAIGLPPEAASATPAPTAPAPSAPATQPARSRRYAGLDGLRALAVAAVLVYHLFPGVLPGGFIGVDVFFVISGFLITSLLMRERRATGRLDLRRFWVRRVRRLLPAIVVLVIVCSSAALAIGGDVLVGLGRQIVGAATFSANWLSIAADSSYFNQDAPELFRNLWSLAVEEQFYLVWPLVILGLALVRPWWARLTIVSTVAVASAVGMLVLYPADGDPTRVYFGSDTHSFGLAIGAALAILVTRMRPIDLDAGESAMQVFSRRWLPPLGILSLAGLGVAAWGMHDDAAFTYQGGLVLVSVLTAIAIWAAVTPGGRLGGRLDAGPLRFVGVRSYGLYLWHWPVFVLVCALVPDEHDPVMALIVGFGSLAIGTAAALLSYRYVEQPIRRHGLLGILQAARNRMRASSPARARGIATLVVAALLTIATVVAVVVAPSATGAQQFIEKGSASLQQPAPGAGTATPPASNLRIPPDPHPVATGPDISAFGDSVMLASAPALQERFPGIAIDAVVSRQMSAAPDLVRAAREAGRLRPVVLVGLGTNGSISADTLQRIQDAAGPRRQVVFVSVQAPRSWTDGVNDTLTSYVDAHPGAAALAPWKATIAPHLDLLADDQIHPGMSGGRLYADALHSALQKLAESSTVRVVNPWDQQGPRPQ